MKTLHRAKAYRDKVRLCRQHDLLKTDARRFVQMVRELRQNPEGSTALGQFWERLRRRVNAHAAEEDATWKRHRLGLEVAAQHERLRGIARRLGEALLGDCPASPEHLSELVHRWQGALLLHFLYEEQTVLAGVITDHRARPATSLNGR